ncbi:MAG: hypothetical protein OHK93_008747, partial [Ramalina farinacea]|nr:hypothetical protein [Ramalina farinacea]
IIFSTATFRYRYTDFSRRFEVRDFHPDLSPLMTYGRHNIDLEIDYSQTKAPKEAPKKTLKDLLHLLATLSPGRKVSSPHHPRSQLYRLKQYHASQPRHLPESSDSSDPGVETDSPDRTAYNPFTLSPLTHLNKTRSPYMTPVALPVKFFDPHYTDYAPAHQGDRMAEYYHDFTVPQKWYCPIRTNYPPSYDNLATATLSITIPEGRYVERRRRRSAAAATTTTTTMTRLPPTMYPVMDQIGWPTTSPILSYDNYWKWQPPRAHWTTAFFGPSAPNNDSTAATAVAHWIHAMGSGWDRLVLRCYRDPDNNPTHRPGPAFWPFPLPWGSYDADFRTQASLGMKALVDARKGEAGNGATM